MKGYDYSNGITLPVYFDDIPDDPKHLSRTSLKQSIAVDDGWGVFISLKMGLALKEKMTTGKELTWTEEVYQVAEYLGDMIKKGMIKVQVSDIERRDIIGLGENMSVGANIRLYTQPYEAGSLIVDIKNRWDKIMDRHKKLLSLIPPGVKYPYDGYQNPNAEIQDFCDYGVLVSHPDDSFCVLLDLDDMRQARAKYENSQK